jgi:sugar phosphate permease
MRPPCDEAVIRSQTEIAACREEQGRWVLVATIVASSMAFIDSTVVNVALPALQNSFGASVVAVQWVVEAYGLTLGALILVGGSMGDLLGRRRIFVLGVTLFALSSIACGIAPTIEILIAHLSTKADVEKPSAPGPDPPLSRLQSGRCWEDGSFSICHGAGRSSSTCRLQ